MAEKFAILRTAKLKNFGGLAASGQHNFRERETQNADAERTHLNVTAGARNTAELTRAVAERLPEKRRKDAVIAIEYLITASPEHFGANWRESGENGMAYFSDALEWLKKRHGEQNIVAATIHLDESTPHMAAYVVPLTKDGRLSAKDFVGGRSALSKMQTSFAQDVGQRHGLQRGVEKSKAVHKPNAAIVPMTAERLALRQHVKELQDEIERLTQQVGTGGDALAKLKARFDRMALDAQTTYKAERAAKNALAEANKQLIELRAQVDEQLVELATAKRAAGVSEGKLAAALAQLSQNGAALAAAQNEVRELKGELAMVTEREKELVEHATAMRAENAGYVATIDELRAVNAVLVEQARQRLAQQPQQAAAQPDQARMEKRAPEAQKAPQQAPEAPRVVQAPLTLEQAQAAAVRAEEKRTGFRLARHDPRAAEIRAAVRAEWEAAAQPQPQQPEAAQPQQQGRQERQERSIPLQPRPQRTR